MSLIFSPKQTPTPTADDGATAPEMIPCNSTGSGDGSTNDISNALPETPGATHRNSYTVFD